jgi:hypothetical protein
MKDSKCHEASCVIIWMPYIQPLSHTPIAFHMQCQVSILYKTSQEC